MSAGVLAAAVLLAGPAAAQEDPCAPGPDGQAPQMCQSGPSEPVSDTGTVGMDPQDPCSGSRPVEEGDGVVEDGGDEGTAVGEPAPGTEPGQDVPEREPEPEREPAREEPAPDDASMDDGPGAVGEDGVVCAFAVPISAPLGTESAAGAGAGAGQLPRTGPYDRLLALTAIGSGLVLVGSGAALAGRRRAAHS